MRCRHCQSKDLYQFLDLGFSPPSNSYRAEGDLNKAEIHYPLRLVVCEECWLVQTQDFASAVDLFSDHYAYFSSTSSSWLEHAKSYADKIISDMALNEESFVVEVASNDGYLLRNFVAAGIPCLGIEPTASTADSAEAIGVNVSRQFFDAKLGGLMAENGQKADLVICNNVYAHVPDINDFTRVKAILKPRGVITLEFPHVLNLIDYNSIRYITSIFHICR